jgi:hypothetical protein
MVINLCTLKVQLNTIMSSQVTISSIRTNIILSLTLALRTIKTKIYNLLLELMRSFYSKTQFKQPVVTEEATV